jgi:deoxyribose-phosphate aldolase
VLDFALLSPVNEIDLTLLLLKETMHSSGLPIAASIDHALLHPTMTDDEMIAGCREAAELGVASVCVKPYAVPLAVAELRGTPVAVGTVVGFPHGANPTEVKAFETRWAVERGAREIDMVINVAKALAGEWRYVESDIRAVVEAAAPRGAIVKVILETDFISDDATKQRLCTICEQAGAHFVKTSTGFGFVKQQNGDYNYVGATEHDVQLMRSECSAKVGVKASGGIRSFAQAARFLQLGATRLGTSASRAIVEAAGIDHTGY